ncbi:MAG: TetR/AcrR family transcriptional regulator [Actinomycetia bacterium]|nr:TetR/AcrR family transcriptional regulator [Actinomycetes bacterium]
MNRARPLAPDERRRYIIDATTPLVLEHGAAVSTRQIAEACGLAEGTLFRAFESKDAIVAAVCQSVFDPSPVVAELDAIDRDLPLAERAARTVTVTRAASDRVRALLIAFHSGRMGRQPRDHQRDMSLMRQRQVDLAEAVGRVLAPDADRLQVPLATAAHYLLLLVQVASMNPGDPFDNDTLALLLNHGICRSPEDPDVQ